MKNIFSAFFSFCVIFYSVHAWSAVSGEAEFSPHGLTPEIIESLTSSQQKKYLKLKKSLSLTEKKLGGQHPIIVNLMEDIGMFLQEAGHYSVARRYYRQAMHVAEKNYPPQHPKFVVLSNRIARSFFLEKRYKKADKYYQIAFKIMRSSIGTQHIETANFLQQLGGIYYAEGLYPQAEQLLMRALNLYEQYHSSPRLKVRPILHELESIYTQTKQPLRAEKVRAELSLLED